MMVQTNEKSALIPIRTSKKFGQAVSARQLHEFLDVKKDFSHWIKHRIDKYGLIENQDFIVFAQIGENLVGGRPAIEYALTIDAAKELAMVEGNAKGKEARQYFIECEKQLRGNPTATPAPQLPQTYLDALKSLVASEEKRQAAEEKVQELAPKAEYADKVLLSATELTTTTLAKEFGMSAIALNKLLVSKRVQFWHDGHYTLYQQFATKGLAKLRTHQFFNRKGESHTNHYLVWTETGRQFIHSLLNTALNN